MSERLLWCLGAMVPIHTITGFTLEKYFPPGRKTNPFWVVWIKGSTIAVTDPLAAKHQALDTVRYILAQINDPSGPEVIKPIKEV